MAFQMKMLPSSNLRNNITLPTFIASLPDSVRNLQSPRPLMAAPSEFITPTHHISRPNSPSSSLIRVPSASHGRIASIRRESDYSGENEAAHEKYVKCTQQVSLGFDEFCLDEKLFEERKRAKSLTEPISIFTNAFLPHSSSPSPTRCQCYSPSTQQMVRCNISYSPSPSPTPSSPTRNRIMRSMSPIAVRQISKRRYTGSEKGSGLESDGESTLNSFNMPAKRQCTTPRSAASPLVRDSTASQPNYDEQSVNDEDSTLPFRLFCAGSVNNDNNSSTTFSSRANTPFNETLNETDPGSIPSNSSQTSSSKNDYSSMNLSEELPPIQQTSTIFSTCSANFSIANVLLPPVPQNNLAEPINGTFDNIQDNSQKT